MRPRTIALLSLALFVVVLAVALVWWNARPPAGPAVRIAAWNLHVFGDAKASDPALLELYAKKISAYDIVVLQEIRDKDGSALAALCARIPNATCVTSSRAGRSSSKEQYAFVMRGNATLFSLHDYNPDPQDRWERPPARALVGVPGYNITLYAIHTKPDDAQREVAALEGLVLGENPDGNVAVLGDLNADCAYYDERRLRDWRWFVPDDADTTIGPSKCAYDRIVLNGDAARDVVSWGIDNKGVTSAMSDHALVWVALDVADR